MELLPQHQKLNEFMDYFVEQWMDNPTVPTALWNVHAQRQRTNNVVEAWNSKINRMINRNKPNVQLLVKCLKNETNNISHAVRSQELGEVGEKRRKKYVLFDLRIENIMKDFERSKDLRKCLTLLSHAVKID